MKGRQKNSKKVWGKGPGKLQGKTGETLVEMMASIVIASLAVALLFSAVMVTAKMDRRSKKADEEYYEALSAAEIRKNGPEETEWAGTVTVTGSGAAVKEMDILFYGGNGIYAYGPAGGSGEGESPEESGEEAGP